MPQRPNPQFRWRLCGRLPGVGKNRGWRHLHAADLPVGHATQRAGRMRGGIECPARRAGDEVPAERGSGAVWHMSTKASAMLARPDPRCRRRLCGRLPSVRSTPGWSPLHAPDLSSGQQLNAAGECEAPPPPSPCPAGQTHSIFGACLPNSKSPTPPPPPCANGETRNAAGACVPPTPPPPPPPPCPGGGTRDAAGVRPTTTPTPPPPCPAGQTRNAAGVCVTAVEPPCPTGEVRNSAGTCVKATEPACPGGETRDAAGACVKGGPATVSGRRNAKRFG